MFYLYGIQTEYTPNVYDYEGVRSTLIKNLVATFDTKEAAQEYVKKSRLKNPCRQTWTLDINFRANSLLSGYNDFEIEEHINENIPHNPN